MDDIDEIEVQTRHKRHLEKLREKEAPIYDSGRQISRGSAETSERSIWTTQGSSQGIDRSGQGTTGENGRGAQGMEGWPGTDGRSDQGIRSADTASVNTDQSTGGNLQSPGEGKLTADLTPEEKAERERELARQRKQRQRDREKLENAQGDDPFSSSNRDRDRDNLVTDESHGDVSRIDETSRFQLKNPLKFGVKEPPEKVKLFTKTEAQEAKERLAEIYFKGSGLIDTLIEIIVKDHEPVSIWQLSEEEADIIAEMHLKKAQIDQNAARAARTIFKVYDKLYIALLLGPKFKATYSHIKDHGGISFR